METVNQKKRKSKTKSKKKKKSKRKILKSDFNFLKSVKYHIYYQWKKIEKCKKTHFFISKKKLIFFLLFIQYSPTLVNNY
jgi:hypothetical protein